MKNQWLQRHQADVIPGGWKRAEWTKPRLTAEVLPVQAEPTPTKGAFELRLRCTVVFHANPAEYERALEHAEHQLVRHLHRDMLDGLHRLRAAVFANDEDACHEIIDGLLGAVE